MVVDDLKSKLVRVLTGMPLEATTQVYRNRLGLDEDAALLLDFRQIHMISAMLANSGIKQLHESTFRDLLDVASQRYVRRAVECNMVAIRYLNSLENDTPIELLQRLATATDNLCHEQYNQTFVLPSYRVEIINCASDEIIDSLRAEFMSRIISYKQITREETIALTTTPDTKIYGFYSHRNSKSRMYVFLVKRMQRSVFQPIKNLLYQHFTEAMTDMYPQYYEKYWGEAESTLYARTMHVTKEKVVETILSRYTEEIAALEVQAAEKLKQKINATLTALPNAALTAAREAVNVTRDRYSNAVRDLRSYEQAYMDAMQRLYMTEHSEDAVNKAVAVILNSMANKLHYIAYDNSENTLRIIVENVLQFFDGNKLKAYLSNPRSVLSTCPNYIINLCIEIFVKRTIKVHMLVGFKINVVSGTTNVIRRGSVASHRMLRAEDTGIPNPHHEFYDCWGDNRMPIIKAVQDGKLEDALMIAYAATAGINISDTAVFNKLLEAFKGQHEVYWVTTPFIEKDGKRMSIQQYKTLPEIHNSIMEV